MHIGVKCSPHPHPYPNHLLGTRVVPTSKGEGTILAFLLLRGEVHGEFIGIRLI